MAIEGPRLSQPRKDVGRWGALTNKFLRVAHEEDGTLKTAQVLASIGDAFGTSIGTGLLLDGTVLKASAVLQKYHAIDPSADVQSLLGADDIAAINTLLGLGTGDSPTLDDLTLTNPSNIYALDHDSFAGFVADEHIDWTDTDEDFLTTGTLGAGAITGTTFNGIEITASSPTSITFGPSDGLTSSELKYTFTAGVGWSLTNPVIGGKVLGVLASCNLNQHLLTTSSPIFDDLTLTGDLGVTGTVTGATGSIFGNLTLADGSITDSSGAISFGDENLSTTGTLGCGALTLNLGQDFLFTDGGVGGRLLIQGQTANQTAEVFILTKDMNGEDNVILSFYATSTGIVDYTNSESLRIGYHAAWPEIGDIYVIGSGNSGTGDLLPIHIYAGGTAKMDQLVLGTDGNNSMSGDLTVSDLIIADTGYIGSATTPTAIQIAANGDVTLVGTSFTIPYAFYHAGDGDTGFLFPDSLNQINLQAGGATGLVVKLGSLKLPPATIVNNGNLAYADFQVKGYPQSAVNDYLFYVDTDGLGVGIKTAAPAASLDVLGTTRLGDSATNYSAFSATGDQTFAGSAGFYPRFLTQAAEPAAGTGATQCDTSEMVIWKDSDDNKVYFCFNDGGTVKTVEAA